MAAKSQERRLPNLPESKSEFWDGEVNLTEVKGKGCRHHFEIFDREIKCTRCGVGYYTNVDDIVEEGHLYHNGKLVV